MQVGSLREVARQELLELLDSLAGSKALVWDPGLTGPMGLVAEYSLLKEHGVTKMFSLAPGPLPPTNAEHVIFLTRPTIENMDTIAGNIKAEEMRGGSGVRQELHLVFTPRTSLLCEQRLVQVGAAVLPCVVPTLAGGLGCHGRCACSSRFGALGKLWTVES